MPNHQVLKRTPIDGKLMKGYKRRNPAEAGCRIKRCYQHHLDRRLERNKARLTKAVLELWR